MTSKTLSGMWKGFFELDESYGPVLKGKKGYFELKLTETKGKISGICTDTHGFGVHENRTATIEGKFENGQVEFVKKYQSPIPIDAFGKQVEGAHFNSDVHYTGSCNAERTEMSGKWKISITDNPENDEDYTTGNWEMSRE